MKTILVDAVFAFVNEDGQINEPLHALLEQYDNPKLILTNADFAETNAYNLCNMPYPVFTLKNSPNKADLLYYKTLLEQKKLKAKDVVYFEHGLDAVKSAQRNGIKTYHYDSETPDFDELKTFLDTSLAGVE